MGNNSAKVINLDVDFIRKHLPDELQKIFVSKMGVAYKLQDSNATYSLKTHDQIVTIEIIEKNAKDQKGSCSFSHKLLVESVLVDENGSYYLWKPSNPPATLDDQKVKTGHMVASLNECLKRTK